MSQAVQEVVEETTDRPKTPKVAHCYCRCQRFPRAELMTALCGFQKGDAKFNVQPKDYQKCVVCVDLMENNMPCPVCGRVI